ncbi:heat-inducible transcriptional repressor HrcA [Actinomyces sp.]|uniref:heat-inducible transcriptional repressor HrcA n=1 Tax=Actinomyces sp. TaxID=29317 RepID=UPI00289FC5A4|nr:heat-inducible transcriptional repressor HrcA [Actinomyces sp.]
MADSRRLDVLRAIVSEYVHTREPVGSKAIAASHDLGVSPATIRNDMAALEEQGLIFQPHTSAGRVPTDSGYRVFVDRLAGLKPMSAPERRAVESFLAESVDLDDVVNRTVRLLAQVTHQVAVVQYPSLSTATLRRLELVDLGAHRVLLVVITNSGRVEERMLDFPDAVDPETVRSLRIRLNQECENLAADQISPVLDELRGSAAPEDSALVGAVCEGLLGMLRPATEARFVMAGVSNLARAGIDLHDIAPVLDALEEQVALLRLFSEVDPDDRPVHVTIGSENPHDAFTRTSVVSGSYGRGEGPVAHIGVVGPTRMDYPRTMSTVRAVAAYLSRYLDN